jgi:hypothetical protein
MNKKISELDLAASLTGTEELPIIQSSTTVKTTVQDIANIAISEIPPINTSSLQEVTDEGSTTTNTIYTVSSTVSNTNFIGLEVFDGDVNYHRIRPSSFVYDGEEGDITLSYEYPLASYNLTIPAANGTLATLEGQTLQQVTTTGKITNQEMILTGSTKGDLILDGNDPVGNQPAVRIRNTAGTDNHIVVLSGSIFNNSGNQLEVYAPAGLDAAYMLTYPKASGVFAVVTNLAGLVLQTNQPSNPLTGSIYFDSSSVQLKVWNGGWVSIS